jgi:hypothetical protein
MLVLHITTMKRIFSAKAERTKRSCKNEAIPK